MKWHYLAHLMIRGALAAPLLVGITPHPTKAAGDQKWVTCSGALSKSSFDVPMESYGRFGEWTFVWSSQDRGLFFYDIKGRSLIKVANATEDNRKVNWSSEASNRDFESIAAIDLQALTYSEVRQLKPPSPTFTFFYEGKCKFVAPQPIAAIAPKRAGLL